jgi:hypothetical protein
LDLTVSEVGDEEVDSVKLAGDVNTSYVGVERVDVVVQINIMSWGSHVAKCVMAQQGAEVAGEVLNEGVPLQERGLLGYTNVPKMSNTCHVKSSIPDLLI